jgi:hypothetical protein
MTVRFGGSSSLNLLPVSRGEAERDHVFLAETSRLPQLADTLPQSVKESLAAVGWAAEKVEIQTALAGFPSAVEKSCLWTFPRSVVFHRPLPRNGQNPKALFPNKGTSSYTRRFSGARLNSYSLVTMP